MIQTINQLHWKRGFSWIFAFSTSIHRGFSIVTRTQRRISPFPKAPLEMQCFAADHRLLSPGPGRRKGDAMAVGLEWWKMEMISNDMRYFFSGLFHGNLLLHVILVGMNGNTWEYKTTSSGPWTIIWGWELMFWSTTINIWDHPSINGWYIWLFGKPIVKSIYIKKEPGVECGIHPFRPPKMPQKERSSTQQKFRLEVGIT